MFARRIVGWRVSACMHTDFVLDALEQALCERKYTRQSDREAALIHHSDCGSQYASAAHQGRLTQHGLVGSMSRKGNRWRAVVVAQS